MADLSDGTTAAAWACLARCIFDGELSQALTEVCVPFEPEDLEAWNVLIETGWFAICSPEIAEAARDLIARGIVEVESVS